MIDPLSDEEKAKGGALLCDDLGPLVSRNDPEV